MRFAYAKAGDGRPHSDFPGTDLGDNFLRVAHRTRPVVEAPFSSGVGSVFGGAPKPEVPRVDAFAVVARVADKGTFGDRAVVNSIGNAMSPVHSFSDPEVTITARIDRPNLNALSLLSASKQSIKSLFVAI